MRHGMIQILPACITHIRPFLKFFLSILKMIEYTLDPPLSFIIQIKHIVIVGIIAQPVIYVNSPKKNISKKLIRLALENILNILYYKTINPKGERRFEGIYKRPVRAEDAP